MLDRKTTGLGWHEYKSYEGYVACIHVKRPWLPTQLPVNISEGTTVRLRTLT